VRNTVDQLKIDFVFLRFQGIVKILGLIGGNRFVLFAVINRNVFGEAGNIVGDRPKFYRCVAARRLDGRNFLFKVTVPSLFESIFQIVDTAAKNQKLKTLGFGVFGVER